VPARAQLGHRSDGAAPLVGAKQVAQRVGRPRRAASLLELKAGAVDRKLQLPDALATLGAAPERDAGAREGAVCGVVIDGREDAWFERLAAEVRELEPARRLELSLVLHGRLHGGGG